jgi:hypothetical protein
LPGNLLRLPALLGASGQSIAKEKCDMASQQNEGEGNHTAARKYNEAQQEFAQSGKVGPAAKDAAKAVDGPEGEALRQAEELGKRHARGEDPQLKK